MHSNIELLRHIDQELVFLLGQSERTTQDEFLKNDLLTRAFARSLEIVGEAVKQLSTEFVLNHPEVEWRRMAGMRDKLIHGYFSVDYSIVWEVVVDKIPSIHKVVFAILSSGEEIRSQ